MPKKQPPHPGQILLEKFLEVRRSWSSKSGFDGLWQHIWYGLLRFLTLFLIVNFLISIAIAKPHKPLIAILMNQGDDNSYSIYPWYAIRQNYSEVIAKLGGVPIFIGYDNPVMDDYIKIVDGFVLTGGDFNSPEEVYTTGITGPLDPDKYPPRTFFEILLVKKAYEHNIPVLGICAGMQTMNVVLGGTLVKNLQDSLNSPIQHRHENREQIQHSIILTENTKLQQIMKVKALGVNSNHREGIQRLAPMCIINAKAPDGAIEGIEAPNKRFFIGVMWHPEFLLTEQETLLWQAFIQAASS